MINATIPTHAAPAAQSPPPRKKQIAKTITINTMPPLYAHNGIGRPILLASGEGAVLCAGGVGH
ncbi:hypothetical protein KDW_59580 [Dictyobacter vulcani]|uniref:Uncharacterized protein n=1 Tax=Dictyobacter vulcani TaxID=2607529 RepID=A0A5J4L2V2_9CHLR|nr:hypothetical protein KDW_59580 [Dictyobacter vulcani]